MNDTRVREKSCAMWEATADVQFQLDFCSYGTDLEFWKQAPHQIFVLNGRIIFNYILLKSSVLQQTISVIYYIAIISLFFLFLNCLLLAIENAQNILSA